MRGHIPEDTIEEIKRRVDIVGVVSEYVTLKRAGRNLVGLCPFHKEKTPSFTINPEKQIYYCFGCSQGGGAIDFLMKAAQMTYPEALRHLARKSGVVIPETSSSAPKEGVSVREKIIRANQAVASIFSKALFSQSGGTARQYIKSRGIGEGCVRAFQLGFAPDGWSYLRDRLKREGIEQEIAAQAGLLIQKEEGGFYDRFRSRLIFPIFDVSGRVIAFGGRIIGEGEPKYLNSPESPVYVKGHHLYGLNFTKEVIREKGHAIIVEGYFDLIVLWNSGVKNVVATLGTALTAGQVNLLKRYTGQVMAVFDPDEAGQRALIRSLPMYLAGNLEARAVVLPGGLDPADFVGRHGAGHFERVLQQAPAIEDYYISHCLSGGKSLKAKQDDGVAAIGLSMQMENPIVRNLFLKKVGAFLGVDLEILKAEYQKKGSPPSARTDPAASSAEPVSVNKVEMALIRLMIGSPDRIPLIIQSKVLECFETSELMHLGLELHAMYGKTGKIDAGSVMARLQPIPALGQLAGSLVAEEQYEDGLTFRLVDDMINQIRKQWAHRRRKDLRDQLVEAEREGNLELCERLLREIEKLGREQKAAR